MSVDFDQLNRSYAIFMFKMDMKARIRIWRKLSKLLGDGIPIITALEQLRDLRKKGEPSAIALNEWAAVMKNGKKFSDAVKSWVTSEEVMLLTAGEQSGTLTESFQSVVKVAKAKENIGSAVKKGLAYPSFLLLLSFGVMYLFSNKIIPAFARSVRSDNWQGMARTMIDVSAFAQNWLHWIALAVVIFILAIYISLPRWDGPARIYFDRFAPYSIYRIIQGSSWLIALSALVQAGVRIDSALDQLMKGSSKWSSVRIAAALRGLRSGQNLGDALLKSGYEFPDREIISDIRVYANKSGFDEAIRLIADEWITESVERIQDLMGKVFGVTLLIAAGIVAFEVSGLLAMQLQLSQLMQHSGR